MLGGLKDAKLRRSRSGREGLKVPQEQAKRGRLPSNDGSCARLRQQALQTKCLAKLDCHKVRFGLPSTATTTTQRLT